MERDVENGASRRSVCRQSIPRVVKGRYDYKITVDRSCRGPPRALQSMLHMQIEARPSKREQRIRKRQHASKKLRFAAKEARRESLDNENALFFPPFFYLDERELDSLGVIQAQGTDRQ